MVEGYGVGAGLQDIDDKAALHAAESGLNGITELAAQGQGAAAYRKAAAQLGKLSGGVFYLQVGRCKIGIGHLNGEDHPAVGGVGHGLFRYPVHRDAGALSHPVAEGRVGGAGIYIVLPVAGEGVFLPVLRIFKGPLAVFLSVYPAPLKLIAVFKGIGSLAVGQPVEEAAGIGVPPRGFAFAAGQAVFAVAAVGAGQFFVQHSAGIVLRVQSVHQQQAQKYQYQLFHSMYPNGRETGCRQSKVAVFLNKPKGREPLKRLVELQDVFLPDMLIF